MNSRADDFLHLMSDNKCFGLYAEAPRLTYDESVEVLSVLGKLINFPIFRSQSSFFKPGLHEQFIQDYQRMQSILTPYEKKIARWLINIPDDSYYKFQLTLTELKKIVVDKILIGYLPGTCRRQDDPWYFRSPISIETFCLINDFNRRIHLIL